MSASRIVLFLFTTLGYRCLSAQTDTVAALSLKNVTIEASKIGKSWLTTASSTYFDMVEEREQVAQNSLQEYLLRIPSVFSLNANNRAQDLRVSIRGFGSRASFGVRGVKLIVDGIPETTADGQGQLDNLNLGIIQQIEVLNNGSAALYGNASGGVVNIKTFDENVFDSKNEFVNLGFALQSFGGQQYQLTTGRSSETTSGLLHLNHHQGNGYRQQSGFRSSNLNARLFHHLNAHSRLELLFNFMDSPQADDPGGVSVDLYDSIPTVAREANLQYKTGERINQYKAAIRYTLKHLSAGEFSTYAFYSGRKFDGRLPFLSGGIVDLKRAFLGQGVTYNWQKQVGHIEWRGYIGYDFAFQKDDRVRYENLDGIRGNETLNQQEDFFNFGSYLINDLEWNSIILNMAMRYDMNKIEAADNFLSNGDDSGSINLNDFNYAGGLAYKLSNYHTAFINHTTSFETPTLNELSNNPDGSGFNPGLMPQRAAHYELGIKGLISKKAIYQFSLFSVKSINEILPFEIAEIPGRTFYQNVGETRRRGAEWLLTLPVKKVVDVVCSWTINDFTFSSYELDGENYGGFNLPGLPGYFGNIQLHFTMLDEKMSLILQQQFLGKIYMDDANTEFQSSKAITNVSLKYDLSFKSFDFYPYIGANNLLRTSYADNIRINAFGGRFYEAAPDLFLYGGFRVEF